MKQIIYNVALKDTNKPHIYPADTVYTNDKDSVQFVFNVTDMEPTELTGATAKIYLYMRNGSMYQETATVSGGQVTYVMTGNQPKHSGQNKAQIELTISGRTYASPVYLYTINPGLESQVAQEVMIKDWTTLTAQARAWLDDAEADEEARKLAEQQRVVAEAGRVSDFSSKADFAYVDTELAKKATVTELTEGLGERYTKDETDGLLAGKADLADSLTMENLVTNGDFSQGTTGWIQNGGVIEVVFDSQLNKNVMEVTSDNNNYPGARQEITNPGGNPKFYISALLKRVSGTGTTSARPYIGVGPSDGVYSVSSEYIRISTVYNTTRNILYLMAGNAVGVTAVVRFADVVVLNLTQIFGADNEPTQAEMDKLIDLLGGWFDGEISLSQKQVAIWTLNMIRKNRNAIVALGGTIA